VANITVDNNTSIAPWGGKRVAINGDSGPVAENDDPSDTARYRRSATVMGDNGVMPMVARGAQRPVRLLPR
jgi:hypothetical protein